MQNDFETNDPIEILRAEKSMFKPPIPVQEAFSSGSAYNIKSRAYDLEKGDYVSELTGELMGESIYRFERSHIYSHDRKYPMYDDPDNGLYVTTLEHFVQHSLFRGRAGMIGLSEKHNNQAINSILERVREDRYKAGVTGNINFELEDARRAWMRFYQFEG